VRALVTAGLIVAATLSPAAVPQGNASRPAHHHPEYSSPSPPSTTPGYDEDEAAIAEAYASAAALLDDRTLGLTAAVEAGWY
jgi:hypothetical protein